MPYKMHPDDVKARNWEFLISDRFPNVMPVDPYGDWARHPGFSFEVARRRAALVNAHPDSGDVTATVQPWIEALESELERALGLVKPPAVSTDSRGESENRSTQRPRMHLRVDDCQADHTKFKQLAKQQQSVLRGLARQHVLAEGAVQDGVVGVMVLGVYDMYPRSETPSGFMSLKEARELVNGLFKDAAKQRKLVREMTNPLDAECN